MLLFNHGSIYGIKNCGEKLTIPAHKPIKPIYIKQFLALIDRLGESDE